MDCICKCKQINFLFATYSFNNSTFCKAPWIFQQIFNKCMYLIFFLTFELDKAMPGILSSFSNSLISASTPAGLRPEDPRTTLSKLSSISCNL